MTKHMKDRLSARFCDTVKAPGRYEDGRGLGLLVSASGAKRWVQRIMIRGKRVDLGLGGFDLVSLSEARDKADKNRKMARDGLDPREERRKAEEAARLVPTFNEAVESYLALKQAELSNPKHAAQWRTTLATYAGPVIGRKRVDEISVADVLRVLTPIWQAKNETASRVRGRIEAVLAWATTHGFRPGDNPARWKHGLDTILPKPGKVAKVTHHGALPIDQAPAWFAALGQREGMAALAVQFLALTWARSGEVRGATWHEIDLERGTWTVPACRMKAGREHRVALSGAAVALLRGLPRLGGSPLVFFAPRGGVLSDMSLSAVMRRMHADKVAQDMATGIAEDRAGWRDPRSGRPAVPHGLRSTARDWAAERGFDRDLCELALAHRVGSDVERAYRRSDMLDRRRALAEAWAGFLVGKAKAKVVPIRR